MRRSNSRLKDLLQFLHIQLMYLPSCLSWHSLVEHNDLDATKPLVASGVLRPSSELTTPHPRRPRQAYFDNILYVSSLESRV